MAIRPIFLFSISRSGSTLIQRIIAAHQGIATTAEPWLLLPHAYTLRPGGVDAEYVHPLLVAAIEDFSRQLPHHGEDYREQIRHFALSLYRKAAGENATHFLDKSPPYCLVADQIINLFPEAKFIFLWRNPLSAIASMIETWGPWHPTLMDSDLFLGLPRLIAAYEANRARSHAVRFEDLVSADRATWSSLMDYLEIDFEPEALINFPKVKLNGRMGDPTGATRYSALSREPEAKWKATLSNPLRRAWCRRYLLFLGTARLAVMGYDRDRLLAELAAAPSSFHSLVPDLARCLGDLLKEPVRVQTRRRALGELSPIRELLRPAPPFP
jgi:sulfotransferase family protein